MVDGGPALLVYYSPAFLRKAGAQDAFHTLRLLTEVYRQVCAPLSTPLARVQSWLDFSSGRSTVPPVRGLSVRVKQIWSRFGGACTGEAAVSMDCRALKQFRQVCVV